MDIHLNLFGRKKKSNHKALKIVGGAALAALAAGVIVNFSDIRRYIRMSTM
ncbi:MAG TPA: hypothetical protein VNQ79_04065 [Blastocatellia bacterium]|nr:hypothetical protein [Blastocatellia bacterium]